MFVTLSLLAGAGQQFFDNNGVMLTGGKLFTYFAGTTTPNTTYTDASGNNAHTNPIILDAAGRVPGGEIWLTLGIGYKFVLKTSTDILIATYDNIPSSALPPAANNADSVMYEQGYTVTAGSFVAGQTYRIVTVGTTNFTLIGATSNTPGVYFIATGAGTGTGTAELSQTVENKLREYVSVKDFGAVGDGATNDTIAIQAALDDAAGGSIYFPKGVYLITDTLYVPPATTIFGDSSGDAWAVSSTEKGSCIKISGAGTARVWTDVGLPATPAGTLVDAPITVAVVFAGSGCSVKNIRLEGGTNINGSDAWDVGFFNPSVKRTAFLNVETLGYFRISGCYVDATWSNINTALINIHATTYGRAIFPDTASNEIFMSDCYWDGGNWGLYVKGTVRSPLPSPNIWAPGGVSDLSANGCRFGNLPIETSGQAPENSGAYYRDLQNNYQNRYFTGCNFRSSSAYSVYLDRGRWDNFIGLYGETRASNCVTQAVSLVVDSLGVDTVAPNNGAEWTGSLGDTPVFYRVYLTNTTRIDLLSTGLRPDAVVTTATGSCTIKYVGFDATANRAYIGTEAITGTISAGQSITQAAGQTAATVVFYATDRDGGVYSTGQSGFVSASGLVAYYGVSTTTRNFRSIGLISTLVSTNINARDSVEINCNDATQINFYINQHGVGTETYKRLRFSGRALLPYSAQDLGSNEYKWTDIYATNGTIITSDERHKQQIQPIEDAVFKAWEKVNFVKFKMNDSVTKKGPAARWHFGVIAQRIKEAFESEGLNAFDYGVLCYAEWPDEYEELRNENGDVVERKKINSSGNIYSVRYDEALALECAFIRWKMAQMCLGTDNGAD
jgi:hypothetical protein